MLGEDFGGEFPDMEMDGLPIPELEAEDSIGLPDMEIIDREDYGDDEINKLLEGF